jgi:hypothetical protein
MDSNVSLVTTTRMNRSQSDSYVSIVNEMTKQPIDVDVLSFVHYYLNNSMQIGVFSLSVLLLLHNSFFFVNEMKIGVTSIVFEWIRLIFFRLSNR